MKKLLSWSVLAVILPSLVGLGFGVLALGDLDDFIIAKACFLLVCFILGIKIILWGAERRRSVMSYLLVFIVCGAIGVVALASVQYVNRKREAKFAKAAPPATPTQNNLPAIKTSDPVPPSGLRLRRLEFTIPKAGEQMWAVAVWENTSDKNIIAHGGATVYTIGLTEKETAPITRATEHGFEAYGWSEYQKLNSSDKATELEPHAQIITRHQSDPQKPMTQFEIDEMQKGRARTYVVGGQRWTVNGEVHGCDFCAWTSGDSIAVMCYQHNRCF